MDDEATAEDRLDKFCRALETNDVTLMPRAYNTEDHAPFCADMREVLAKAATLGSAN